MANHWLLNNLGSPHSWIFAPTQNEELGFGFDAKLVGFYKLLVIQYKGTRQLKGRVAFDVDPTQRATLVKTAGDHAYYGACSDRSYAWLAASFAAAPSLFFERCYFIPAATLPADTRSIRITPGAGTAPPTITVHGPKGVLIATLSAAQFWDGPDFANDVKACKIGVQLTKETLTGLSRTFRWPQRDRGGGAFRSFTAVLHRFQ